MDHPPDYYYREYGGGGGQLPFSVLQLDPADRAVLRIAGKPINSHDLNYKRCVYVLIHKLLHTMTGNTSY